jgi:hypothetical protein
VYVLPTQVFKTQHKIFSLYEDYKDVFEKKNVDILLEHWPYDYIINLEKGAQPYFGPIYKLSQYKLEAFQEYFNENLEKGFIEHPNPLLVPWSYLLKKKVVRFICASTTKD